MELKLYCKNILVMTGHIDAYKWEDEGIIRVAINLQYIHEDPIAKNVKIKFNHKIKRYFSYYLEIDPDICSNCYGISRGGIGYHCPNCNSEDKGVIKIHYDVWTSGNEEFLVIPDKFDKMEVVENDVLIYSYKPTQTSILESAVCNMCGMSGKCLKMSDKYVCAKCWDEDNFPEIYDEIINKESGGFDF